jgi:hypothetical protein
VASGALVNGCETTACLRSLFTNVHNPLLPFENLRKHALWGHAVLSV